MGLLAGLTGALLVGLAGWWAPSLIAPLPEPAAGPADADGEPAPPSYREIARGRRVRAGAALAAALAAGSLGWVLGWSWQLAYLWPLVPVGVALAVVDWRRRLLPTRVIAPTYLVLVPVVVAGALLAGETGDLVRAGWGWLVAGGVYAVLWFVHPAGMGYGDVRLSGVLGIALGAVGWGALLLGLWLGFVLGGVVGLVLTRAGVVDRSDVPFGPFMLLGGLLGVLAGEPALGWLLAGG